MRKKWVVLILLILLITGAILWINLQSNKAFYLNDEYYKKNSLIDINSKELKVLEKDQVSFVVFVYQPLCAASNNFEKIIKEFLEIHKMSFYKLSFSSCQDTKMGNCLKFYPSIVIYQKGEIVTYLDANEDKDFSYYESVEGFKKWFTNYVLLV